MSHLKTLFEERRKIFGTWSDPIFNTGLDISNMWEFFFGEVSDSFENPTILNSIEGKIECIALIYDNDLGTSYYKSYINDLISLLDSLTEIYLFGNLYEDGNIPEKVTQIDLRLKKSDGETSWIQDFFMVLEDNEKNLLVNNYHHDPDNLFAEAINKKNSSFIPVKSFFRIPMGNVIVGDDFIMIGEDVIKQQIEDWKDQVPEMYRLIMKFCKNKLAKDENLDDEEALLVLFGVLFSNGQKWIRVRNLNKYDETLMLEPFSTDKIQILYVPPEFDPDLVLNSNSRGFFGKEFQETRIVLRNSTNEATLKRKLGTENFFGSIQYHLDWFITYAGNYKGQKVFFIADPVYKGKVRDDEISENELLYKIWQKLTELKLRREIFGWDALVIPIPMPYKKKRRGIKKYFFYSLNNCLIEIIDNKSKVIFPFYSSYMNNERSPFPSRFKNVFNYIWTELNFEKMTDNTEGSLHCNIKVLSRN